MKRKDKQIINHIYNKIDYEPNFDSIRNKIEYDKEPAYSFFKRYKQRLAIVFSCFIVIIVICVGGIIVLANRGVKDADMKPMDKNIYSQVKEEDKTNIYDALSKKYNLDINVVKKHAIEINIEDGIEYYGICINGKTYLITVDEIK